jgi:hypothetical protein
VLPYIQEARHQLNSVRQALLSPEPSAVEQGIVQMESVINSLSRAAKEVAAENVVDPKIRAEIANLRSELSVIARLAEQGLHLQAGWAAMLATAFAGYTDKGASVPLPARGQVCLEG